MTNAELLNYQFDLVMKLFNDEISEEEFDRLSIPVSDEAVKEAERESEKDRFY